MSSDELITFPHTEPAMVSVGRTRNGQNKNYYMAPGKTFEPDADDLKSVNFGLQALIAGGQQQGGKSVLVLLTHKPDGPSKIEVREMPSNVIRFESPALAARAAAGRALVTDKGVWLAVKFVSGDTATDDLPAKVFYATKGAGGKLALKEFPEVAAGNHWPTFLHQKNGDTLILTHLTANKGQFFITKVAANGVASKRESLQVAVASGVESWAASNAGDRSYLAYVDDDSLVDQANLKIARIRWYDLLPSVIWLKSRSLTDEHVSEPVWMVTPASAILLLPKWIDEESTLASYRVSADDIGSMQVSGIFPKGTRAMSGFTDEEGEKYYAVMRQKGKIGWRFQVCKLKDL